MKKKYSIIMAIVAVLLVPCLLIAAGTVTQSYSPVYSSEGPTGVSTMTFAWTTDSAGNASATTGTTISDQIAGKYVVVAVTDPDATDYPTDDYDVVITDANSVDLMGGVLLNRESGSSQQAAPYMGALYGSRPLSGTVTISVTNAGSGKSGTVILYLAR